ncbi:MAG: LysR substrate-binding domain-containing protein [Pseudomonadota bacterium]
MNLQELRYLLALAETRHFGRAADRCCVSQPTLSAQVRKLEEELGVALFERGRHLDLTPVGRRILARARAALEEVEAIRELARAERDPLAGPLRLGVIPTLSPYLIPLLLTPLRAAAPQLRLVPSEEITETLVRRLRGGELDALLLATETVAPGLTAWPLFEEPFWLAFPRDHRLYRRDEIRRRDLDEVELLLLADDHCLARQVMAVCGIDDRRETAMADLRATSLETLLHLVGAGLGATLVPALALRGAWTTDTGVVTRPIQIVNARRRIDLVFRSGFPRRVALQVLVQVIQAKLPNTVRILPAPDPAG